MIISTKSDGVVVLVTEGTGSVPDSLNGEPLTAHVLTSEQEMAFRGLSQERSGVTFIDGVFSVLPVRPLSPQLQIANLERTEGAGVYVRGVREFMLGMAQVIVAQGGPDILQTPGMQNVKRLDDKIKVLRSQI